MQARFQHPASRLALSALACLWLAACGGGSDSAVAAVPDATGLPTAGSGPTLIGPGAAGPISAAGVPDAAQLPLPIEVASAPSQAAAPASAPPLPAPSAASASAAQQSGSVWLTTSRAGELSRYSQIVRLPGGTYVAVRDNVVAAQGGADSSVFLRRLDPNGNPVGADILVGRGSAPGVAAFADGTFLVTWLAPPPPTFSLTVAVNGQLFDSAAAPSGAPLALGVTAGTATPTALADGSFVLATFGNFSRVNGPSGFVRTYTRTGTETGFTAALHDDACGIQGPPDVAALASGGFAVAWPYACVSAPQVRMRVYGAGGALAASSRMQVGVQGDTATVGLAPLTNGSLALEWTLGTSTLREVHTLVVSPFNLPSTAAGAATVPLQPGRTPGQVQAVSDGGFVIPWSASSETEARVPVSRFSNTGAPL